MVAAVVAHIPAAFVAADCKHVGPNLECAWTHKHLNTTANEPGTEIHSPFRLASMNV